MKDMEYLEIMHIITDSKQYKDLEIKRAQCANNVE